MCRMLRDALSAGVSGDTLRIAWTGSRDELKAAFESPRREQYTPDEIDLSYRVQPSSRPAATGGVLSLTDALTGTYLLEINVSPSLIEELTQTADDGYVVELCHDENRIARFPKDTLLVYSADGTLLRERSLIPDSIEI